MEVKSKIFRYLKLRTMDDITGLGTRYRFHSSLELLSEIIFYAEYLLVPRKLLCQYKAINIVSNPSAVKQLHGLGNMQNVSNVLGCLYILVNTQAGRKRNDLSSWKRRTFVHAFMV